MNVKDHFEKLETKCTPPATDKEDKLINDVDANPSTGINVPPPPTLDVKVEASKDGDDVCSAITDLQTVEYQTNGCLHPDRATVNSKVGKAEPTTSTNQGAKTDQKTTSTSNRFPLRDHSDIIDTVQPLPTSNTTEVPPPPQVGAHAVVSSSSFPTWYRNMTESQQREQERRCGSGDALTAASTSEDSSDNSGRDIESGQPATNHLVEAHLVKDDDHSETELVHAEQLVEMEDKGPRYKCLAGIAALVIVVLIATVMALVFGKGDSEKDVFDDSSINIIPVPTGSAGISTDAAEQQKSTSQSELPCFGSNQELYDAMTAYYEDPSPTSTVAQRYGYPLGTWCVSNLRSLNHILTPHRNATSFNVNLTNEAQHVATYSFQQDLGDWDLTNARTLEGLFWGVQNLSAHWGIDRWGLSPEAHSIKSMFMETHWTNPPLNLSQWSTSGVKDMAKLFQSSTVHTAGIGHWDTRSLQVMNSVFEGASDFNEDIGNWNTQSVTSMQSAFKNATSFNQDIGRWQTPSLLKLNMAFLHARGFNQPLGEWDVSKVSTLRATFQEAVLFNQDLSAWDVSQVTTLKGTFRNATSFNQDVSSWNVSSAEDLRWIFHGASSFSQNLCHWGSLLPPNAKVDGMFKYTNCPNTSDPLGPEGPFCFNCL